MELKITCGCGQKYKFDVEPVNGRMPFTVNCPACGGDGTPSANDVLAGMSSAPIPLTAVAAAATAPSAGGLRLSRVADVPSATSPHASQLLPDAPKPIAPIRPIATRAVKAPSKDFSMGLGILGAFLGAMLGGVLVYAFYKWAGFRFPLSGIGIGALSGYGARLLGRGTHTTLGIIAGAMALASIVGVFYLMYGEFFMFGIISIVICVGVAYRLASE